MTNYYIVMTNNTYQDLSPVELDVLWNKVSQNSYDTCRFNNDGNKFILKWSEEWLVGEQLSVVIDGPYNHSAIRAIVAGTEWAKDEI